MNPLQAVTTPVQTNNPTGLEPLGQAVLVELFQPERKTGKIVMPEFIEDRNAMVEMRARVLEIGPDAWHDEPVPRAEVGDLVVISKFAGFAVGKDICADGKPGRRVVNGRDIFLRIKE